MIAQKDHSLSAGNVGLSHCEQGKMSKLMVVHQKDAMEEAVRNVADLGKTSKSRQKSKLRLIAGFLPTSTSSSPRIPLRHITALTRTRNISGAFLLPSAPSVPTFSSGHLFSRLFFVFFCCIGRYPLKPPQNHQKLLNLPQKHSYRTITSQSIF